MVLDPKETKRQLNIIWADRDIPVLETAGRKYVLFSDLHFGDKSGADDFRNNEKTLLRALNHYRSDRYDLILLGDIEELWQFDLNSIKKKYNDSIYAEMRQFGDDHIYRVYGNHDGEWGIKNDPIKTKPVKEVSAVEALKMKTVKGDVKILLVHGHQGDIESDKASWFSKFAVRIFRYIEPLATKIGFYGNPSMTKSEINDDYECILYSWAKMHKIILICGHSHRAIFESLSYADRLYLEIEKLQKEISKLRKINIKEAEKKLKEENKKLAEWRHEQLNSRAIDPTEKNRKPKPCYFNTGCGLFREGLTCLEIDDDKIRLVKWYNNIKGTHEYDIYLEGNISEYIKKIEL